MKHLWRLGLPLLLSFTLRAQTSPRILTPIDDSVTVPLSGNVHPLARAEFDAGAAQASEPMHRMIFVFSLAPATQAALDQMVAEQNDPSSPQYQKWITPQEYAQRFGLADADLNQITGWLSLHGFQVEEVAEGRGTLLFSGTAGQVEETFHTTIHHYQVNGVLHHANATDPAIPAALAGIVGGIASLHDFESAAGVTAKKRVSAPELSIDGSHYLAPADFATVYDVNALYSNSISGTGQTIAVVARSNVNQSDVTAFRSEMGLPANNPVVVLNGANPGVIAGGEQDEATLDAEWAGAVAKNATVQFVVSASTETTDGVSLSAQYIVNHNLAPVMTTSFGMCEQAAGASQNAFWNSLWEQAAAQGITSFVAAGDGGAAGCDSASETTATGPLGVNALGSSPYNVAVGGTEFNDTSNPSQYWSASNSSALGSALTYIPESVWNQSGTVPGGSQLWARAGEASTLYAHPAWQTGTGVPSNTHRLVPDASLAASTHDAYLIYLDGGLYGVGGTSAATPTWAGIMALVNQRYASAQGNANTTLYALLGRQFTGGTAVFHDITSGNNSVPGLAGYTAGTGYDEASGIGSPDANLLVQHWTDAALPVTGTPSMALTLSASTSSVQTGSPAQVQAVITIGGTFKSAVALAVTGAPAGLTASWSTAGLASPGAGSSTLTLTAASNARAGVTNMTVTGTGDGVVVSAPLSLSVQ